MTMGAVHYIQERTMSVCIFKATGLDETTGKHKERKEISGHSLGHSIISKSGNERNLPRRLRTRKVGEWRTMKKRSTWSVMQMGQVTGGWRKLILGFGSM